MCSVTFVGHLKAYLSRFFAYCLHICGKSWLNIEKVFFFLEFISGVLKWYSRDWAACIYIMKIDQITGKNVGNLQDVLF